jgi:hypothetical protein
MADERISFLSKEYIRVPIRGREAGAVVNMAALADPQFAFTSDGSDPASFTAGAWETDATTTPDTYFARVLVGGTGTGATITLPRGTYTCFVKWSANPEAPVKRIENLLEIF